MTKNSLSSVVNCSLTVDDPLTRLCLSTMPYLDRNYATMSNTTRICQQECNSGWTTLPWLL